MEVDLSAYGCSCGGRLVIYHQFGGKCPELVADCEFSYTGEYYSCERCGFSYYESHDYKYDDFCNEVAVHSFFFKLRGEKDFVQYVIDERKTGYNCHSNSWESINEVENITDDSGNVIKTIETNGEKYVCENCHAVTYINKYINTCDSDGDVTESRTETYHYSSDLNGIYLAEEYIHRWEKVVTDYGFINREVYYSYAYYDDDGSKYSSYTVVTVHGDGGSCRVDRFVNDNGYEYVETEYNHNTDWKRVEEECSEEWIIDENGNRVRVVTVSEERYCTKCYGSFEKIVYINVFDEDGFAIRYIEERYDPYAISETDYGYRIRSTSVTEYGVYGVVRGEYKTYVLRHTFCNYDENGELVERNERVYDYRYGNYCHYMMTETNIYGDIIEEREGSEHIRILQSAFARALITVMTVSSATIIAWRATLSTFTTMTQVI